MHRWICIVCGAISLLAQVSNAEPILSASTENSTQGERIPLPGVARALLNSSDKRDLESLKECMADKKIRKGVYERLFRSVALPSLIKGETLYFVRPALEPYCHTFYGAHLFRYWLIVENERKTSKIYKVRYAGVADEFEVFSSASNCSYDIAETNCNAVSCSTVVMKFNGKQYEPFRCSEKSIRNDSSELEKSVPCNR
jgi:hypothetical protein